MSLRARLLAVTAVLVVVGLVVANVATYAALRSFLTDRVDGSLAASAEALTRPLSHGFPPDRGDLEQLASTTPGIFIQFRSESGGAVFTAAGRKSDGSVSRPELPQSMPELGDDGSTTFNTSALSGGGEFRTLIERLPFGGTVIVAAPLADVEATLHRLFLIELLVSIVVVAAIVALGLWLVRVGLRPLRRIEDTAAAIAAGDLSRRIEDANPRTEVGRLGATLNTMLGQIEEAFAERTASEQRLRRFIADASHELRTPLSAVLAYAELFDRGARDRPDDLERAMAGIERESLRMGVLVDDLLLLARLDQGRPLQREPVDVAELAAEAVDAARALEPARPLELVAPDELVVVVGDQARLRQVLDNLLANVRAHTPPGAGVTVRVAQRDGRAVIEIADEGPGLTEEQAARVFERFYRADPSRSRDGGGSGLGLAIVSAIAAAHGGSATVDSRVGRGTTFRIDLPLASSPASEPIQETPTPAGAA